MPARRAPGAGRGRRGVERGVLGEDRGLEALELGAGLQAEFLDERAAGAAVGFERVGLAAGAVEREHQLGVEALAVRVLGGQRLQLGASAPWRPSASSRSMRRSSAARRSSPSRSTSPAAGP